MTSAKYIGMDVHKESISIAVLNSVGKVVMECVIETKASMILQFLNGLSGDLHVTFEEGTAAAWLYDLLKPHVTRLVVCNPRRNALLKVGNKSDRIDARKDRPPWARDFSQLCVGKGQPRTHVEKRTRGTSAFCPSLGRVAVIFVRGFSCQPIFWEPRPPVHSHRHGMLRSMVVVPAWTCTSPCQRMFLPLLIIILCVPTGKPSILYLPP